MLKKLALVPLAALLAGTVLPLAHSAPLSEAATSTARYARKTYSTQVVDSLAGMVSFNTVADPKVPFEQNPQHLGFKKFLKSEAERLGFDFRDDGYVVVIGYGKSEDRVGVITHGDVQPVDPSKWKQSPFTLDRTSEPGLLLARGTEDDKGPIATALYAMKSIKDRKVKLKKRIELYVYMAEESDWAPLEAWLKEHKPPQVNITIDAEYPVVIAEKGWGQIEVTMPADSAPRADAATAAGTPQLESYTGGFFGSQIPEDARVVIANATPELEAQIRARAAQQKGVQYQYAWEDKRLKVAAKGFAAHSSKPWEGVNAIAMLADALAVRNWSGTQAGNMVDFVAEMIGTGMYGERFGKIAYEDSFMGKMTVAPTTLKLDDGKLVLGINVRRPRGKSKEELDQQIHTAFDEWKQKRAVNASVATTIGEPWIQNNAPQIPTLLSVFSHYTGIKDAKPIALGGGTNSRLFPSAVSFGPTMPGKVYTGHSEHEHMTEKQLLLNLEMYTAVLVELAR
jgi:dipeptidase D